MVCFLPYSDDDSTEALNFDESDHEVDSMPQVELYMIKGKRVKKKIKKETVEECISWICLQSRHLISRMRMQVNSKAP